MLCNYIYRTISGYRIGYYQCDTEDFKNFFKKTKSKLMWVKVNLDNGISWLWHADVKRWFQVPLSSESDSEFIDWS